MALTISSSPSLSEKTIKNLSKQERALKKEALKDLRKRRNSPSETKPEVVSNPSNITNNNQNSSPVNTQQTTSPADSLSKSKKRELADLRGASVVNIATQGVKDGSSFSVFASGKGPGAIDTDRKSDSNPNSQEPQSNQSQIKTVA